MSISANRRKSARSLAASATALALTLAAPAALADEEDCAPNDLMCQIRKTVRDDERTRCPCPPCADEVELDPDPGWLDRQVHDCSQPTIVTARDTTAPCSDFLGFVCGPESTFAQRKETLNGSMLNSLKLDSLNADAALDLWIQRNPRRVADLGTYESLHSVNVLRLRSAGDDAAAQALIAKRSEIIRRAGGAYQDLIVDVAYGTAAPERPEALPGESGPAPLYPGLQEGNAQAYRQAGEAVERVRGRFLSMARGMTNLTANERTLMERILNDVIVIPPTEYKGTDVNREAFDEFCRMGGGPALFPNVIRGPDGTDHRYGMVICPNFAASVSPSFLESAIAHEFGHSIDPNALEEMAEVRFGNRYLGSGDFHRQERAIYRRWGTGLEGNQPAAEVARGLHDKLYGRGSTVTPRLETVDGHLQITEGTPPISGDRGWLTASYGGCRTALSRCAVREEAQFIATTLDGDLELRAFRDGNNIGNCDKCLQLSEDQTDEIAADELGARIYGETLNERVQRGEIDGDDLRGLLRSAFEVHCFHGPGTMKRERGHAHPPGPARLARVIGPAIMNNANVALKRALGCDFDEESPMAPASCEIGALPPFQPPFLVPTGGTCIPSSPTTTPNWSATCN